MLIEEITRRDLIKGIAGAAATGAASASKADMFAKSYEQGCQIIYKKGKKYRECDPRVIELSDPIPPEYQRKAIDYYKQTLENLMSQMPDPEAKSNQDYAKKAAIRYTSKAFGNKWMYVNGSWQDPDTLNEAYQGGLRKWFKEKWVNLAKKKKGGGYEECGSSGDKKGYAKCVPAAKAASMSDKEEKSAVNRKRAAQRKAGRPGKRSGAKGKAPIRVSTKK